MHIQNPAFKSKINQFFIEFMHRQAHNIEIRTLDCFNAGIAYPFLCSISTRLVVRPVIINIVNDLIMGKLAKIN
jgi:hypothetical protein